MSMDMVINGYEVNSKTYTSLILKGLRFLEENIRTDEYLSKDNKMKKWFIPEDYKEIEIDGQKRMIGCGKWKIKRKGFASLFDYFNLYKPDSKLLKEFVLEEHEYELSKIEDEKEKQKKINKLLKEEFETIKSLKLFLSDILVTCVIEDTKKIKINWE